MMKKILALALALVMVLSLAACGGKTDPAPSGSGGGSTTDPGTSQQQPSDTLDDTTPSGGEETSNDPLEALLQEAGLTFEAIKPSHEYLYTELQEKKLLFFLNDGGSAAFGTFYYGIVNACKAVADDGKLYIADMSFMMGNGSDEFTPAKSEDELNAAVTYMDGFGYYKDGESVTIGVFLGEYTDAQRNDGYEHTAYALTID